MACLATDISIWEALTTTIAFTILYVAVLFLPCNTVDRHAPTTIFSRAVTLTALAIFLELYIRIRLSHVSFHSQLVSRLIAAVIGAGLTLLLYTGHLLASPTRVHLTNTLTAEPYRSLRNYLLAPVLEELVFRRQTLLIWSCQPIPWRLLFPAIMFSMAHVHHIATTDIFSLSLQLAYTFLFGVYAAALYLNTQSVMAPLAAHIVCNILELPDFVTILAHTRRTPIVVAYALGIAAFAIGFAPSTLLARPYRIATE